VVAGPGTVLRPVPEALVIPAGGCGSVKSGGRSAGGATVTGAEESVPGAVARVCRPGRTVPGTGVVPFGAESFHTLGEFVNAPQKFCIVCWLDNARGRGPRSRLDDAVCADGRSVQLDPRMGGKSGPYVGR
jgi:hypothetical protein